MQTSKMRSFGAAQRQRALSRPGLALSNARSVKLCATSTTKILARPVVKTTESVKAAEQQILDALSTAEGRGTSGISEEQRERITAAVAVLEADGGLKAPTANEEILDGKWRLLYTSRPGTASPIQNAFTGVKSFSVYQEVVLAGDDAATYVSPYPSVRGPAAPQAPRISNIVDFGSGVGYLKVEAEASTTTRPLEGFTPRQGPGLALFGRSETYLPKLPDMRIDFQFDCAAFYFSFLPFSIPYPVPFKLLGDETKGWIDITYMNPEGSFRLSRGNKGTLFILTKEVPRPEKILRAIAEGNDDKILALIATMEQDPPIKAPARSPAAAGKWRLIWSQQADNASPLQKLGSKQSESFQIIDVDKGTLENQAETPFGRLAAVAECTPASDTRTTVDIKQASITIGPLRIPLPVPRGDSNPGYVDWLYLDGDIRITRGSKGSLFVHVKEEGGPVAKSTTLQEGTTSSSTTTTVAAATATAEGGNGTAPTAAAAAAGDTNNGNGDGSEAPKA